MAVARIGYSWRSSASARPRRSSGGKARWQGLRASRKSRHRAVRWCRHCCSRQRERCVAEA
eukprot:scaffold36980_cov29-Tisochrysis_lutea.AAC.4